MLNFIGYGSAFNTSAGNNSAYFYTKETKTLNIIDVGADVFSKVKEGGFLDDPELQVNVLITHTHTDHIGSLADLIYYMYFKEVTNIKKRLTVYTASKDVNVFLNLVGVLPEQYTLVLLEANETVTLKDTNVSVFFEEVPHYPNMDCYSVHLKDHSDDSFYFYSADCNEISKATLDKINLGLYKEVYLDTSTYDFEGNPHCSFNYHKENISVRKETTVYLMHLDGFLSTDTIESAGFKSAEELVSLIFSE